MSHVRSGLERGTPPGLQPVCSDLPTADGRTKQTLEKWLHCFLALSLFCEGKISNFTVMLLALVPISAPFHRIVSTGTFIPTFLIPFNQTCGPE